MQSDHCLSCPVPSVCNVGVLWPNSWTDQIETWHAGRPRLWPHCVGGRPSSTSPKGHSALPQFAAHICRNQMAQCIKFPLHRKVGLDPSDIALDGNPAPLSPKKGQSPPPIFGPCLLHPNGSMDQEFKMPLGMEVGLDPSDIVLDGEWTQLPSPKNGSQPPIFSPSLLWPNGCIDQDATRYGGRPPPRPHCARREPSSPSPKRGHSPQFLAHVCCGQTVGWIKLPHGTMVGLSLGRTTLH